MKLFSSFRHALCGIAYCIRNERNFRIHITAAVSVLLFSIFYGLSRYGYLILILTIAPVPALEAINTAVERVTDLAEENLHPLAKAAKDAAAAGVLIAAAASVFIAFILFSDTDKLESAFTALFTFPLLPLTVIYIIGCLGFIFGKFSKRSS